ncbi:metallophosphoesterase family protein [Ochrobactrum chromiisoli]|uniref:Metallophosphoesterase family protein n=1 Tax=Ochrobactrum chromiisoli TaxID=2993941 RepID=A0ABT3QMU1_9HYPH|nr:metallophosphoesterase family protein [Ochrobactrum chromiisoli]MCX2696938.1 metallophosphoesterase family protein [Ochrobactrum chromiisoli]
MKLTYAIGDVHGCADLLQKMLSTIEADADGEPYRVIFLGDIIDRGSNSRAAMELVCHTLDTLPGSFLIQGNHEELLLRVLACDENSDRVLEHWKKQGGDTTFCSYSFLGYENSSLILDEFEELYPRHLRALKESVSYVIEGQYLFVHAGIRPGVTIAEQKEKDLRWIREGFLDFEGDHGYTVVHGHTITDNFQPERHPNRINLDSGAYVSGRLSALKVINGERETMLTVSP